LTGKYKINIRNIINVISSEYTGGSLIKNAINTESKVINKNI
jgi:hypothetical protein